MAGHQEHSIWAWGWNQFGQLGDGTRITTTTPVEVSSTSFHTIAISTGQFHNLALDVTGTVWAWGANQDGQLGRGNHVHSSIPLPLDYPALSRQVRSIAAGGPHSLALKSDGTVWSWGCNKYGQLGDGTFTNRTTPTQVDNASLLSKVTAIAAGGAHNFALKSDGTLWAWGANCVGQLGDGTKLDRNLPIQVLAFHRTPRIMSIAAGNHHSLALLADGTLWAWGYNYFGQLGNGSHLTRTTPLQVDDTHLSNQVMAVAAGQDHSLALKSDGTVWSWGDNQAGQLGDGTLVARNTPVPVHNPPAMHQVVAIAAGGQHSLALNADGTLWAWGNNSEAQLGNSTLQRKNTPVQVDATNLRGAVLAISAGLYHNLILIKKSD